MTYTTANAAAQARYRERNLDAVQERNRAAMKARRADPEKNAALKLSSQRAYFKKAYGLTLDQVQAMWEMAGGACALCGKTAPAPHHPGPGQSKLAVDHCHETGATRGLLCFKCNTALGQLGDTPAAIERVRQYVHNLGY